MPDNPAVRFQVFDGPSLSAASPAVVAEFASPAGAPVASTRIAGYCAGAPSAALLRGVEWPPGDLTFADVVVLLTRALQDVAGFGEQPVQIGHSDSSLTRIAAGFIDRRATLTALHSALQIASTVFASEADGADRGIPAAIEQAVQVMRSYRPDFAARHLMTAARQRNIPVYPVSPGAGFWRYGQGSAGWVFSGATTHDNSFIGSTLTRNKFLCNQLIVQLGFPGVEHALTNTFEGASQIARHLGFPVVVKPVDLSKGRGVTTNIADLEELRAAFSKARAVSSGRVLVERYVPGDDHRIAVFGGKFKWVSRRSPPRIVGNGTNTVAELIDLENQTRSEADIAAGIVKRIVIDDDMRKVLAKQGSSPEDRPAVGRQLVLRSVANVASGGTVTDCSPSIHPDNREMAEAIALNFHMEAIGIDFMTTDISKSWRELACAVIEVNSAPGFSGQSRADLILAEKIPLGRDGRLPSVILIGADPALIQRVSTAVEKLVDRVGQTGGDTTAIAGQPRCRSMDALPARVQALLLEATCDALVIGASVQDIETYGLPLDRFDLALIVEPTSVSSGLRQLIGGCAGEVIDGLGPENFDMVARTIEARVGSKVAPVAD